MLDSLDGANIYCVLDALDECDETSLSALLSKLKSLILPSEQGKPRLNLHVIIASRELPHCLPAMLSRFPHLTLDALDKDIRLYISDRVSQLAQHKGIEESSLCHHIEDTFRQRAGGTFLWVSLMAQDLEMALIQDIERTLEQLPRGLSAVYERVLAQFNPNSQETVTEMLRWLLHATRPLRIIELCEALDVQATNQLTREQVCVGYVQACGHLLLIVKVITFFTDFPLSSHAVLYNSSRAASILTLETRKEKLFFIPRSGMFTMNTAT